MIIHFFVVGSAAAKIDRADIIKGNKAVFYKNIATGLIVAVVLGGCASAGVQQLKDESATTVGEKITKGKSTKDDVRATFGDPTETSFTDSGNEIWRYRYSHSTAKGINFVPLANIFMSGQDVDKKELVVFFDDKGVVKNFAMQSSKEEVKGGILPQ
ncbi:outer membrane protein assembly factor BamE [Paraburkholderia sp. CNPSo 3281]|uniref:outer membrane protein assembly factor BamE domain-containing protein n=1 Tax=Paraburkholderia sp. CNPSo 3281 TaxID=2940933 RepID=UPI0020B83377|nr:outer membrane protein assembly factor BamE [Paraburkholderia sp. CNPSo 3281]MCP3718940.1 outer membrane protein assembly factor BamE [Paraburkholderia sp. CNPSo 3281]